MKFYKNAKEWDKAVCPNTCKTAVVTATKKVKGVTVIEVINATYRNATVSGYFAVADDAVINISGETVRIPVYCLWFKHRLPTGCPTLLVNTKTTRVLTNYTGEIAKNIGKPKASI